jgi:hypothetical protein
VYIYNKTFALHRLVALTFLDNPVNKETVNHIDGNKLNNKIENLEFATNKEQQIHKHAIGLGNNFTRKVKQYDLNWNFTQNILTKRFYKYIDVILSNIFYDFNVINFCSDQTLIKLLGNNHFAKSKQCNLYMDENAKKKKIMSNLATKDTEENRLLKSLI